MSTDDLSRIGELLGKIKEAYERFVAGEDARGEYEGLCSAFNESYRGALYGFCFRILGNSEDALDVMQKGLYIILFEKIETFKQHLPPHQQRAWIFTILKNLAIEWLRRRAQERQLNNDYDPEAIEATPDTTGHAWRQDVEREFRRAPNLASRIRKMMKDKQTLTPELRRMLLKRRSPDREDDPVLEGGQKAVVYRTRKDVVIMSDLLTFHRDNLGEHFCMPDAVAAFLNIAIELGKIPEDLWISQDRGEVGA